MSEFLLVCDAYPPEVRSAAQLMREMAEELAANGHDVTVLTCLPARGNEPAGGARGAAALPERRQEAGDVLVLRCRRAPRSRMPYWLRGLNELWLPVRLLRTLRRHRASADAVIVYTPALPLGLVGAWVKRRWRARFTLNVQDLFPQNAIDLGVLRNPLLIAFYRLLERRLYAAADIVTAHSEGNRRMIVDASPALRGRVHVAHNWVRLDAYPRDAPSPDYRALWRLKQPRVAVFAGVMGPSQRLDLLLRVAASLRDEAPDLLFLLVGDGAERPRLERQAAAAGLDNVRFEGFVAPQDYPALLRACDLGIVCLSAANTTPVVPAKTLGYMAACLPVLGLLHANSDAHAMIEAAQCGLSAVSGDEAAVLAACRELLARAGEWPAMGQRGRRYVAERFSARRCVAELSALALGVSPAA